MAPKREEDESSCTNRDVTTGSSAVPSGNHANYGIFLVLRLFLDSPPLCTS